MCKTQRTGNYELQSLVVSNKNRNSFIHSVFQIHHGKQSKKEHCTLPSTCMSYEKVHLHCVLHSLDTCYVRSRNEWIYYNDTSVSVVPSSEINMSRHVEVICFLSNAWFSTDFNI